MLASKLLSQSLVWLAAALLPLQAVPMVCACSTPHAVAVPAASGGCCSHQQAEDACGAAKRCDSSRDCECCGVSCLCAGHDRPTPEPIPAHAPQGHHYFAAPVAVATALAPLAPTVSREAILCGTCFAPSSLERCVALSRLTL